MHRLYNLTVGKTILLMKKCNSFPNKKGDCLLLLVT